MFYKNYFKPPRDIKNIVKEIKQEGFSPQKTTDEPNYIYEKHTHPETKLLVFLKGTVVVETGGAKHTCEPGDKLVIPGNVEHSAIVGPKGCEFFWAEKL